MKHFVHSILLALFLKAAKKSDSNKNNNEYARYNGKQIVRPRMGNGTHLGIHSKSTGSTGVSGLNQKRVEKIVSKPS